MPNYRVLHLAGQNYENTLVVRTTAPQDEDAAADWALIFQTTRGAHVWLGADDVTALVNFGRAEVLAWETERNRPDDIPDDVCGERVLFEGSWHLCCLGADHLPVVAGQWTHITSRGAKFNEF